MSAQIRQERSGYYEILDRTQKETMDVTPWLDWSLGDLLALVDRGILLRNPAGGRSTSYSLAGQGTRA